MAIEHEIERFVVLLLVAASVSMLGRKLRLPFTVGLVLTGLAIAFSPVPFAIHLTKDLIFIAFLPPLIFEAALQIRWNKLRAELAVVGVLATVGVVISTVVTALGMHEVARWPWQSAIILGVLLSATDPVSVIATFKEIGAEGRLKLLIESESILNDGTAAALFGVAIVAAGAAGHISIWDGITAFVTSVVGGVAVGAVVGAAALLLAGRTQDHLVETTFTLVAAYGSFLVAQHFAFSGVLATLTAGLLLGNLGPLGPISAKGRAHVVSFWEFIAFVVNSIIFLLIGSALGRSDFKDVIASIAAAVGFSLAGRAAAVYGVCLPFAGQRSAVPWKYRHILFWGGLRGALALALVLGLPSAMPARDLVIKVTFAVVAFSVLVQGVTIGPMLKHMGPPCSGAAQSEDES